MRMRKLVVTMPLGALLGSDFALAISPAFGQTPSQGTGQPLMPSLGGGDGTYGRVLPGPSTTAPYAGAPQQPLQMLPQTQPQMIQRPVGPTVPNVCQPAGGARPYQTVSIPRTRIVEPIPAPQPLVQQSPTTTVTQVTVSQGAPVAPAQAGQQPAAETRPQSGGPAPAAPEVDELSRIEAGFNLDPVRQMAVPMGFQQQSGAQRSVGIQQVGSQQQLQQQITQDQAYLGPFGTPLRQYGYSMFAANVSTFAPVDDIPVGPDYVLGPGDDLSINVWGAVDSTLIRTVDRNGRIVLPKVGDLRIWGLTFSQADRLIRDELARFFRGFQTSVTMGRLRTVSVHVVGEVCQPGVYTLSSLATVTNALYSAGGPTKVGSPPQGRLPRSNHQVAPGRGAGAAGGGWGEPLSQGRRGEQPADQRRGPRADPSERPTRLQHREGRRRGALSRGVRAEADDAHQPALAGRQAPAGSVRRARRGGAPPAGSVDGDRDGGPQEGVERRAEPGSPPEAARRGHGAHRAQGGAHGAADRRNRPARRLHGL